jgi:hypothetical protein
MQELMDIRDQELEGLRNEIARRDKLIDDRDWSWCRHRCEDGSGLPVPRIELRMVVDKRFRQEWEILYVTRNYGPEEYLIPFGACNVTSAYQEMSELPGIGESIPGNQWSWLPSLFVDFTKRVLELGLPGLISTRDRVWLWRGPVDDVGAMLTRVR